MHVVVWVACMWWCLECVVYGRAVVVLRRNTKHLKQLAVTRVTPRVLSKKVSKHLIISGGLKILADNKGTEGS